MTFLTISLLASVYWACSPANWWYSFDIEGLSECSSSNDNIRGFFRNKREYPDDIKLLEKAHCCTRSAAFSGENPQVVNADWWDSFDYNYRWNLCPHGYFLNGLWRNEGKGGLYLIEEARCSKPASHPYEYGDCLDQDVSSTFDDEGDSLCPSDYYITGLYRGGCAELHCLDKFKCCKMANGPGDLDSLAAVKTRIMDITLYDMSFLANYLGYGWCGGCRSPNVGEDFVRDGDTWEADQTRRCEGYKANHRLALNYGDWHFELKDIQYGEPILQNLQPEIVDTGIVTNNHSTEAKKVITREEQSVRSVTHTTTSSWKVATELGIQVSYSFFDIVSGGYNFVFSYETSSTTEDSKGKQKTNTFTVQEEKTLAPYSSAKWSLMLSKVRTTTSYTAKVIVRFSTEFRGFLRWGGGPNDPSSNYHYEYRGSGNRPTFNYRFGSWNTPFYEALKKESESNSRPWLWSDMISAYGEARSVINRLTTEGQYEFTLTGKFDDVQGKHVAVRWDEVKPVGISNRALDTTEYGDGSEGEKIIRTVAKALPGDPAPLFPDPPEVVIEKAAPNDLELLQSTTA